MLGNIFTILERLREYNYGDPFITFIAIGFSLSFTAKMFLTGCQESNRDRSVEVGRHRADTVIIPQQQKSVTTVHCR